MILLIDNYDSFTYNLYQYIGELYHDIQVVRNDEITIEQIEEMHPQALILSPGPGYPKDAGITMETIRHFNGKIPMLGVCLGHQSICEAFGGTIVRAAHLMHGKASQMVLDTTSPIFAGLPKMVSCGRYHSLIAQESDFPECLKVTARDENGQIMALQHRETQTYGVQFHPESLLTGDGKRMLANFLNLIPGVSVELPPIVEDRPKTELKKYIAKVADGCDLTLEEAQDAMDIIMSGSATNAQIAGLLVALRMKGETIDEITGFAKGMRNKAKHVTGCEESIEIVGTGGDLANSFNISTTSSFVISAAGMPVAKHGNRSVSSKSGAADVLESLGVKIQTTPEQAKASIQEIGISFLFAQSYHGAMKYVAPARKELGIRTVFNVLGPLTNPAGANMELMGVYDEALVEPLARVLANLGVKKAMVVYGQDGLDEISMSAPTTVCEVKDGEFLSYVITPEQFGFTRCSKDELIGGSPQDNAQIALAILKGEKGSRRDAVVLNSAAAIHIAKGISIEDAIREAQEVIDSGKALAQLEQFAALTNQE
mgnify:CR=1 FL=1